MFADDCDECSVNDHGGNDDASRLHISCLCDLTATVTASW